MAGKGVDSDERIRHADDATSWSQRPLPGRQPAGVCAGFAGFPDRVFASIRLCGVCLGIHGLPPVYLVLNSPHVEKVPVEENRNFVKDRGTRHVLRFLGNGLLTNEGTPWRRQRRVMQPPDFHRECVSAYGETMVAYKSRDARGLEGWRDSRRSTRR